MNGDGRRRDPTTAPQGDRASGVRRYVEGEVSVRIRGLDGGGEVKIHIEHKSGAALIVPDCTKARGAAGPRLSTRGFDGTDYVVELDDAAGRCTVKASAPTPILGDRRELVLPRAPDVVTSAPPPQLRVTGDENTMPISLKKP